MQCESQGSAKIAKIFAGQNRISYSYEFFLSSTGSQAEVEDKAFEVRAFSV